MHVALDAPAWRPASRESWSWLEEGLSPLIALTAAADQDHITAGAFGSGYRTRGQGAELTIANVLTLRGGHYLDRLGDIDGGTRGVGIQIPFGKIAGIRYDFASFPQARDSGLKNVRRHAASAWVDPLEWLRASQRVRTRGA